MKTTVTEGDLLETSQRKSAVPRQQLEPNDPKTRDKVRHLVFKADKCRWCPTRSSKSLWMRDKTGRVVLQFLILKMMMRTWTIELAAWMPYVNMKGPVPRSKGVWKAGSSVRFHAFHIFKSQVTIDTSFSGADNDIQVRYLQKPKRSNDCLFPACNLSC